ncbi:MAG: hypothetical protein PF487_10865, partial [Bacteroidales bacterium]|nr:hypothetical protein [Bacteroidales bacterium]
MKNIILFIGLIILGSCNDQNSNTKSNITETIKTDFTQYVNPFIGTSKMGHVFPGATAPFGMVQLSPQTNFEVMFKEDGSYISKSYEYCAGYQYRDSTIIGFSHTNLSGTGHSDLGDFLIMPATGDLVLDPLITK